MMSYSFIIPVYNCKNYLPTCVESIRAVDTQDYEILLIDDGSTDGSGDVCDALAKKYPEVRVIHQSNGGASAARNRGIREAQGEKILFLDADDAVDAQTLAAVLADSRCDEADLTIFGLTFDYYRSGLCYRRDPLYFKQDGILERNTWCREFTQLFVDNSLSPIWNKVFKRSILLEHQLELNTDMFLYEDLEFVLRYMQHCDRIWNVPQAIYHYRQSEDEGNAGRRVARIASISDYLSVIESTLKGLIQNHPALEENQTDAVLQQLYLVLAKEKIAVSDLDGIRKVCGDFKKWALSHRLPLETTAFQDQLAAGNAVNLYLGAKKTKIRHWIAVRAKAFLKEMKGWRSAR